MKKSRLLVAANAFFVAVACLSIWLPIPAVAGIYNFTKIVDTNDAIPGGAGNFINFDYPTLDGDDIAFGTYDDIDDYGAVLTYKNGVLNIVADTNTLIPNGVGTFGRVFTPKISQGNIIFGGLNFGNSIESKQLGIYTDLGGIVRVVADINTPIPGGSGTFSDTLDIEDGPMISNGVVAFDSYTGSGVYAEVNGSLRIIADMNTPEPGGSGNFNRLWLSGIRESNVFFYGSNAVDGGIYVNSSGAISKTNYTGSHIDFATGNYSVIEYNQDYSQNGLYLNVAGTSQLVAKTNDITPDGSGSFTFFDNIAVDGEEVAILAVEDYVDGNIYRYANGILDEVISIGDILDGKIVTKLGMTNDNGFDNGVIAFQVNFDDGSSGIYLATPISTVTGTGKGKELIKIEECGKEINSAIYSIKLKPDGNWSMKSDSGKYSGKYEVAISGEKLTLSLNKKSKSRLYDYIGQASKSLCNVNGKILSPKIKRFIVKIDDNELKVVLIVKYKTTDGTSNTKGTYKVILNAES